MAVQRLPRTDRGKLSSSLQRRRDRDRGRLKLSARCIRKATFIFMLAVSFGFSWKIFGGFHNYDDERYSVLEQDQSELVRENEDGPGFVRRSDTAPDWMSLEDVNDDEWCLGFDHSILRPKHGCGVNKDTEIIFCNFDNLHIDTSKIEMKAKGGEALSTVMGQVEEDEFPSYQKAAFLTPITPKFDVPEHYRSDMAYLADVMNALRYPKKKRSCQKTYPGTTLFLTRYEYVNLYHTLTDWWNAFFVLPRVPKATGTAPGFPSILFGSSQTTSSNGIRGTSGKKKNDDSVPQKPDRVVFLDGHPNGLLDSVWETLFGEIHFIQHMKDTVGGDGICFERAIFVPPGYKSPLRPVGRRCPNKKMARAFSNFVLGEYDLLKTRVVKGNIVVIDRQPYVSHPRSNPKKASRVFEKSEISELQEQLGKIPGVTVRLVRLEQLSFQEQLQLMRETHVLIGYHGAGLSHLFFMDETQSHSIEFSQAPTREEFPYLSNWKGNDHNLVQLSENGIEKAVGMVKKFMNV